MLKMTEKRKIRGETLDLDTVITCQLRRKKEKLLQSCLTLCDPVDSSPPGSCIHGILQARVLEWAAIAFSRKGPAMLKISYSLSETSVTLLESIYLFTSTSNYYLTLDNFIMGTAENSKHKQKETIQASSQEYKLWSETWFGNSQLSVSVQTSPSWLL